MKKVCCPCGNTFETTQYNKVYCSKRCKFTRNLRVRREMQRTLICECCGITFDVVGGSNSRRFCTPQCKGKHKYVTGQVTTISQYEKISGNWQRYLSRLIYSAGRKRDQLTRDDLLKQLENQNYKCAISGLDLTCTLEKGIKHWSNASVDRINAGGSYTPDNIQLVCRAVNSWRSDMPLDDFIEVCKAVARHNQSRLEVQDGPA